MVKLGLALGIATAALAVGGLVDSRAGWVGGFVALAAVVWLLLGGDGPRETEPRDDLLWITWRIRRSRRLWVLWWVVILCAYLCVGLASRLDWSWLRILGGVCVLAQAIWLWLGFPILPPGRG